MNPENIEEPIVDPDNNPTDPDNDYSENEMPEPDIPEGEPYNDDEPVIQNNEFIQLHNFNNVELNFETLEGTIATNYELPAIINKKFHVAPTNYQIISCFLSNYSQFSSYNANYRYKIRFIII